jgi:hypothetical protein
MSPSEPRIVVWTDHAVTKAEVLGFARSDVEDALLTGHKSRSRNTRAADWLVTAGRVAIAYNHPDRGDELTARIVTLWRRA